MAQENHEQQRPPILLYTDGASSGNPGPGGYGVVLKCGGYAKEMSGGFSLTTNNRMELLAVMTVAIETRAITSLSHHVCCAKNAQSCDCCNKMFFHNLLVYIFVLLFSIIREYNPDPASETLLQLLLLHLPQPPKRHNARFRDVRHVPLSSGRPPYAF